MSRRFVLLFLSTFIAVFLVRIPFSLNLKSASGVALFRPDAALATVAPAPSLIPPLPHELPLPVSQSPALSESHLPIDVHYRFYPVAGTTAAELRSQMIQQSPVRAAEGHTFDALTNWSVHWNFNFNRTGKTCAARSIRTHVDILFTLPQWKKPQYASPQLQAEWDYYMQALKLHEEGHKKNGVDAAQSVMQALRQLPDYPDCRQLEKAAKETADRVIAAHNQRDVEYDRATGHGRTQGAVFPIASAASESAPRASL